MHCIRQRKGHSLRPRFAWQENRHSVPSLNEHVTFCAHFDPIDRKDANDGASAALLGAQNLNLHASADRFVRPQLAEDTVVQSKRLNNNPYIKHDGFTISQVNALRFT